MKTDENNMNFMKEMMDKLNAKRKFIQKLEAGITPGLRVKRIDVDKFGKINITYFPVMELTAKEMFAKLGYQTYSYKNMNGDVIEIGYSDQQKVFPKIISFNLVDGYLEAENGDYYSKEELQAINKQLNELGWLE